MTKAAEMAKVSVKGGFHLLWGLVVSTVISAFGTIYLANVLSSDQMGLYALAIATPTLIGVFRDWGVNAALIRYTAKYSSENKIYRAKRILKSSLFFEVIAGIVLSAVAFLLSGLFANLYYQPTLAPLIQVASFTILMNAFLTVAEAAFTGFERMELNSITLILRSITKALIAPGLVILGFGVFGAVLGTTFSFLIAGVTGTLLLWLLYKSLAPSPLQSDLPQPSQLGEGRTEILENVKILLRYGAPLSIAIILVAFQTQFYTMLIGIYVPIDAVGNYTVATSFVVLITFFATPVATMLFPAFSKLQPKKDKETLQSVYQFSIKYASLLIVPMAMLVMALSEPAVSTLFGNKYPNTPLFLSLLALSYVYTAFGNLSAENLLNGQGKTALTLKLEILQSAIAFPLAIVLVWQLGVIGIILTILVSGIPSLTITLYWIKKHYSLTVDWVSSGKITFSSGLAGAVAFALQSQLTFSSWINLIIGVATFASVFLPSILLTRTIDKYDIENIRQMTSSLGPINRVINPILNLLKKLLILINA